MRTRKLAHAAVALAALAGAVVASSPAAAQGTSGDDGASSVRIVARKLASGDVEFGLDLAGGRRWLPRARRFPYDSVATNRWLASSPYTMSDGSQVRIAAAKRSSGQVEFALRIGSGRQWLPKARLFPYADVAVGVWLGSSWYTVGDPTTPLGPAVPQWAPVNILTAKEDVNRSIPVYDAPNGRRISFPDGRLWSYTYRGNRLVLRVTQGSPGDAWVEAELPVRPNGVRGWIRTRDFTWSTVTHHIHIDVSARRVALYEGDRLVTSTQAIVGTSRTPTPTLSGFLVEKLPNHNLQNASVVLGDWILMLSFFSEVLDSFGGGLPRIALHGTHIPNRVGEALSNGCIRIPNNIIEAIAREAPLGTVVNIVA